MRYQTFIRPISFIVLILLSSELSAQETIIKKIMLVNSAPSFIINVNGIFSVSMMELGGAYNSDFQSDLVKKGETFGTRSGFGASVYSKIRIHKNSRLWITQSLSFNNIKSYLLSQSKTNSDNGKAEFKCFTGGLGAEYNFLPKYSIKVFAGAEMNASIISGSMDVWTQIPGDPYNTETYKILPSFRIGFAFTAGTYYMLSRSFGFNLTAKYNCLNAFLRNAKGNDSDKEFELRDGNSPDGLLFSGNKQFSFFSLSAGLAYYFGVSQKKYRLN